MQQDNYKSYLTPEGYEKVKKEYNTLINQERKNIAKRIEEAKELGDLSENAEYQSAKEDQAFLEKRISELGEIIENAEIIENNHSVDGIIKIGSTVKFKDNKGKVKEYTIVGKQEADPQSGKISNESPIGRAFLGHKEGETIELQAPKGTTIFKILEVV